MSASVTTCSNELIQTILTQLRDTSLKPKQVRDLISQSTQLIAREAIITPSSEEKIAIVVILRSGMQMTEPFVNELPTDTETVIYHLGLFRDKASLQPVEYYNKLPQKDPRIKHAYVLDPILATGGTITAAINILKDWGVDKISLVSVLASTPGLEAASQVWPEGTRFVAGAVDPEVDARGHIQPGLGDIGDRLFGTY